MVEQMMYLGLGFLWASLIALLIIPAIHGRAVRLTERRLDVVPPLAAAEIQTKKDQLRAEFAMSSRRAEQRVEELEIKMTSLLAELGRKSDIINRLKIQLGQTIGRPVGDAGLATLVPEQRVLDLRRPDPALPDGASLLERVNRTLAGLFPRSWMAAEPEPPARNLRNAGIARSTGSGVVFAGASGSHGDRRAAAAAGRHPLQPGRARAPRPDGDESRDALEQLLVIAKG